MLDTLRYLSILASIALLLRLVREKLWRIRPFSGLSAFLLINILRDLALLKPNYETHAYAVLWEETLPILLLAQIVAGIENYYAIANLYPGIGNFARRLFFACITAALIAGLLILPIELHRLGAEEPQLRMLFLSQRWTASLLAGALLMAVLFLSRYPAPLKRMPRNIRVHTACLALYFTSYAVLYTLENMAPLGSMVWAELGQLALVVLIYAAWTAGLARAGQESEPWPAPDAAANEVLDSRYQAAKKMLSHSAAGGGRK